MNRLWFLATLAAFVSVVHAFWPESCDDMIPRFLEAQPQTYRSPYSIRLSKNKIRPGEKVHVRISGRGGETFKGFFVQGRIGYTSVGSFDEAPGSKFVQCHGSSKSAITNSDDSVKESITLIWNAPRGLSERVVFWVTIVAKGQIFWINLKSIPLTVE